MEEGLYLYLDPPKTTRHLIVYEENVQKLLHAISWVHVHGYKHDGLSFNDAITTASCKKLQMTCGSISQFTERLLQALGIPSRLVTLITLDEWNTYDNGHTFIEIFQDEKWVLYDIGTRSYFISGAEKLDALEFIEAVKAQNYERYTFSKSPVLAYGDLRAQGYDFGCWFQVMLLFNNNLDKWYKRIAQVQLIREDGSFYYTCDPKHRTRIESYPMHLPLIYLERNEFIDRFYR